MKSIFKICLAAPFGWNITTVMLAVGQHSELSN